MKNEKKSGRKIVIRNKADDRVVALRQQLGMAAETPRETCSRCTVAVGDNDEECGMPLPCPDHG